MQPLISLISPEEIERLASRSNFRYGKELARDASMTVEKENRFNRIVRLKHGKGPDRTVELMSTTKGFRWKCTCTNRKDVFCEHVVAVCLDRQPRDGDQA